MTASSKRESVAFKTSRGLFMNARQVRTTEPLSIDMVTGKRGRTVCFRSYIGSKKSQGSGESREKRTFERIPMRTPFIKNARVSEEIVCNRQREMYGDPCKPCHANRILATYWRGK